MASVLLLDDQPLTRSVLEAVISRLGHEVSASCGRDREAVRSFQDEPPDLMILDIETQGALGGPGVLRTARDAGYSGGAIFLSACPRASVSEKLQGLTYDSYLEKPVDATTLSSEIDSAIEKHHRPA